MMSSKIDLPELSKSSHLSRQYLLVLGGVINYLEAVEEQAPSRVRYLAKRTFVHREIPYYDVYFSSNKYSGVITSDNRDTIYQINHAVDQINSYRTSDSIDHDAVQCLVDKIVKLID